MLLLQAGKSPTGNKVSFQKPLRSPVSMLEIPEAGKKPAFSLLLTATRSSFSLGNTGVWPELLHVRAVLTGNMAYRLYLYQ